MTTYDWLEIHPKSKEEFGLHDSGYRFISVVGVTDNKREQLHEWSDLVDLLGPVNVDVTEDGVIRIAPWAGEGWEEWFPGFRGSSAVFQSSDWERSIAAMQAFRGGT